jgi:hypothetical protein
MITAEKANALAAEWIAAWNSHNVETIIQHYDEHIEFSSPLIAKILNQPDGMIAGKTELKAYFQKGLAAYPDLKFELYDAFAGVNSVVIYYKSVKNLIACEVLVLNSKGLIRQCICNYKEA